MSPYLCDPRFKKKEREILFKLRSRTIQTKENFQNAYLNNNMLCELCKLFPCTQFHPLQCPSLMTRIMVDENVKISEKHVYGSVYQHPASAKIYTQFWDLRQDIMQDKWTIPNKSRIDTSRTGYLDNILCCSNMLVCYNYLFFGF